jgi:hypothetical protein
MAHWLKQYTYSLVAGIILILAVGILANTKGTDNSMTGYAVYGNELQKTGQTIQQKFIVKDCVISPKEVRLAAGDILQASFVVYDPSGRTHKLAIQDLGIDVRVKGSEIARADVIVPSGTFVVEDSYPCKAMGYKTEAVIQVE